MQNEGKEEEPSDNSQDTTTKELVGNSIIIGQNLKGFL
jgi:hypothetical protein